MRVKICFLLLVFIVFGRYLSRRFMRFLFKFTYRLYPSILPGSVVNLHVFKKITVDSEWVDSFDIFVYRNFSS